MDKSQAAPAPGGQLNEEDWRILKQIEQPEAVPLTEAEKEDLIVNQILLRRLMRALQVEPAAKPRSQTTPPAQVELPRPAQPSIQPAPPSIQPAQTRPQSLKKAA